MKSRKTANCQPCDGAPTPAVELRADESFPALDSKLLTFGFRAHLALGSKLLTLDSKLLTLTPQPQPLLRPEPFWRMADARYLRFNDSRTCDS